MKSKIGLLAFLLFALPASNASAQPGKILGEDHFAENDRGWNLGDDLSVVRKIEGGRLILEAKKFIIENGVFSGKGGYWIRFPDLKLPANNYSVAVTTRWIKNMKTDETYSPYGVILGDYYFLIYGDGDRRLLKYNTTEKKYETIVDWGVSSALYKKGAADNKLEIQVKDGKAGFYVNGQMLYKKDVVIAEGAVVKLYLENSETVAFDDLVVKAL